MKHTKPVNQDDTVYLTKRPKSDKCYHSHQDCGNIPNDPKAVTLSDIEAHYQGCALCVDGAKAQPVSRNRNDYECSECGTVGIQSSTAYRTMAPCTTCQEITSQERVNE